ncbi:hypothetical protein AC1031_020990 [Aphanomyces cochlioides]|nr:hypothetical protein AC1031_020990 [Aphanomyces cochlioides]
MTNIAERSSIWLGGAYSGMSVVRVTEYDDLVAFGLGCFYTSRYVWIAFFAMKMLSKLVKRYGWEAKFMPVDPGFMSLAATLYAGPIFSIAGQTPIMVVFHIMCSILIPSSLDTEAVDAVAGIFAGNVVMASFPISISWMLGQLKRDSRISDASSHLSTLCCTSKHCRMKRRHISHSIAAFIRQDVNVSGFCDRDAL